MLHLRHQESNADYRITYYAALAEQVKRVKHLQLVCCCSCCCSPGLQALRFLVRRGDRRSSNLALLCSFSGGFACICCACLFFTARSLCSLLCTRHGYTNGHESQCAGAYPGHPCQLVKQVRGNAWSTCKQKVRAAKRLTFCSMHNR